jgi:hypothetical protein
MLRANRPYSLGAKLWRPQPLSRVDPSVLGVVLFSYGTWSNPQDTIVSRILE